MDQIEQIIQRYCDGECSPEESSAVQKLIEQDQEAQRIYHFLTSLDNDLLDLPLVDPEPQIEHIMSAIPEWTPSRHVRINTGFIAVMALLCGMALTTIGIHYNSDGSSISTLMIVTCMCVLGSGLALVLSLPGRSPTLQLIKRAFSRSVDFTYMQSTSLRCAAVLLLVLAIWTWSGV